MEPHNKEEIIRNYINAYNAFDVQAMLSTLHTDIEFVNISNGETNLTVNGIEAFKTQAEQAAVAFQSRNQEITAIVYGDNHVEVEINYTGI